MDDFFSDLFEDSSRAGSDRLSEYEEDDLKNFFETEQDSPRQRLLQLASFVLEHLEASTAIQDKCKQAGFAPKNTEKLIAFVKTRKSDLQRLAAEAKIKDQDRLAKFEWSVRSVFFSKTGEFKAQKKYAVAEFDVKTQDKVDKIKVNCTKDNVLAIREKLGKLDADIRQMFDSIQSS